MIHKPIQSLEYSCTRTDLRIYSYRGCNAGMSCKQLVEERWEGRVIEQALENSTDVAVICCVGDSSGVDTTAIHSCRSRRVSTTIQRP